MEMMRMTDGAERDAVGGRGFMGGISVLEEKHMIRLLLYLSEHDGITKTQVYRNVARTSNMPDKLDRLAAAGLVTLEKTPHYLTVLIHLTDKGMRVAGMLKDVESALPRDDGA